MGGPGVFFSPAVEAAASQLRASPNEVGVVGVGGRGRSRAPSCVSQRQSGDMGEGGGGGGDGCEQATWSVSRPRLIYHLACLLLDCGLALICARHGRATGTRTGVPGPKRASCLAWLPTRLLGRPSLAGDNGKVPVPVPVLSLSLRWPSSLRIHMHPMLDSSSGPHHKYSHSLLYTSLLSRPGDFIRPHATPASLMLLPHCPFPRPVQSRRSNNVKLSARPQTASEPPFWAHPWLS